MRLALPQPWPGFIFGDFADDSARKREELPETELDALVARLTVRAGLRVVGGGQ